MDAIQAAHDQSLFRGVNERLRELNEAFEAVDDSEFLCECARQECMQPVSIPISAYEEVRRVPTHFAVAPGVEHVFADVERVFEEHGAYWVVEKFGVAGVAAIKLDPRRRTGLVAL
jgi:hypothetical protein